MPIYEYLCSHCGQVFEKLVLSRDAVVECPHCPGAAVERQFSAFSFKGEQGGAGSGTTSGGGGVARLAGERAPNLGVSEVTPVKRGSTNSLRI